MKDRDNIEELFNDAFSAWEPKVPAAVKSKLDENLFKSKNRGFFTRFRWVLLLLLFLSMALPAYYFWSDAPDSSSANHQARNSEKTHTSTSETPGKEAAFQGKSAEVGATSEENLAKQTAETNPKDSSAENNSRQADLTHSKNIKIDAGKTGTENRQSSSAKSEKSSVKTAAESNSNTQSAAKVAPSNGNKSTNPNAETEVAFIKEIDKAQKPIEEHVASNSTSNAQNDHSETRTSLESKNDLVNQPDSTRAQEFLAPTDSSIQTASDQPAPKIEEKPAFIKSLFIGANAGIHSGRNVISNNLGAFDENRNTTFGLDLSYQFKPKSMLSTGFMYQQRRESFSESVQQVDSVFLFSEPITETFIDTANNDTITVIIGYNDVYDYDTTQIAVSTDAVVRLMLLPLAYNFQVFGWKNHEFWLGTGVNLGLYRVSGSIQQTNQTWVQNQFAMQVFLRPSYQLAFGKWRAGIYGNFVYDAILPQTWSMARRRWQLGGGFQVSYRISKPQKD